MQTEFEVLVFGDLKWKQFTKVWRSIQAHHVISEKDKKDRRHFSDGVLFGRL